MRHAVTVLLDFLWLVFGYFGLLAIAKHFIAGRYRAESVAVAVLVAFAAGVALRQTLPAPAPAAPALGVPPTNEAALPDRDESSDVGGACGSARLGTAPGKGNIDGATVRAAGSAAPIALRELESGDTLVIYGWAAAPRLDAPAHAVCLVVDGKLVAGIRIVYGEHRPDVAKAFKTTALDPAGFEAMVPARRLVPGQHTLQIAAVDVDGSGGLLAGGIHLAGPPSAAR